jgi:hypothetical protein
VAPLLRKGPHNRFSAQRSALILLYRLLHGNRRKTPKGQVGVGALEGLVIGFFTGEGRAKTNPALNCSKAAVETRQGYRAPTEVEAGTLFGVENWPSTGGKVPTTSKTPPVWPSPLTQPSGANVPSGALWAEHSKVAQWRCRCLLQKGAQRGRRKSKVLFCCKKVAKPQTATGTPQSAPHLRKGHLQRRRLYPSFPVEGLFSGGFRSAPCTDEGARPFPFMQEGFDHGSSDFPVKELTGLCQSRRVSPVQRKHLCTTAAGRCGKGPHSSTALPRTLQLPLKQRLGHPVKHDITR